MIKLNEFGAFPTNFKKGVLFLITGWILHYFIYFRDFMDPSSMREVYLQVGVGVMICFFVVNIKPWARMLCIFFNIGIAILYVPICASYYSKGQLNLSLMASFVTILFALSTYYLVTQETARFFKAHQQKSQGQTSSKTAKND